LPRQRKLPHKVDIRLRRVGCRCRNAPTRIHCCLRAPCNVQGACSTLNLGRQSSPPGKFSPTCSRLAASCRPLYCMDRISDKSSLVGGRQSRSDGGSDQSPLLSSGGDQRLRKGTSHRAPYTRHQCRSSLCICGRPDKLPWRPSFYHSGMDIQNSHLHSCRNRPHSMEF